MRKEGALFRPVAHGKLIFVGGLLFHSPRNQGFDQFFYGQALDDDGEHDDDVGHGQDDVTVWAGGVRTGPGLR